MWATDGGFDLIACPVDPVQFNVKLVNEANGWNPATNLYTVPSSGVYYIQLTAQIGWGPTKMELLVNGIAVVNVYREVKNSPLNFAWDTRSRAIILNLNQSDELRIRLPAGYMLVTDNYKYTTFAGFCLYA